MDADALVAGGQQAQEPMAVGLDAATAVTKVVLPRRGILYHGNLEGLAGGRLGGAHVAPTLLVTLVLAHAAGILRHQDGSTLAVVVIDAQRLVTLADDDECRACGLVGQRRHLTGHRGCGIGRRLN